jgi:hypothetical protein
MSGSESGDYSHDGQSDDDLGYYSEDEEEQEVQGESEAAWYIIDASEIATVQVCPPTIAYA